MASICCVNKLNAFVDEMHAGSHQEIDFKTANQISYVTSQQFQMQLQHAKTIYPSVGVIQYSWSRQLQIPLCLKGAVDMFITRKCVGQIMIQDEVGCEVLVLSLSIA